MTDDAPTSGSGTGENKSTGADAAPEETQPVRPADSAESPAGDRPAEDAPATPPVAPTYAPPAAADGSATGPASYPAPGAAYPPPSDTTASTTDAPVDQPEQTAVFPAPGATYVENAPVDEPPGDSSDAPAKSGPAGALAALGSGLLGAGVVIASLRGRNGDGDLDTTVFGSGVAAVAGLLVLSVVAAIVARRSEPTGPRADLVTWPGVVGILGLAILLPVGLDEGTFDGQLPYVIGGLVALLSVLGFLLARRPAFAVTTILGLGLAYAQGFSDLFGDSIDSDETAIWIALGVTAFVVIVTIVGWVFPSRAITGVAVGVVGVLGIAGSLGMMLAMRLVASFFSAPGMAGMADLFLGGMGGLGDPDTAEGGGDPGLGGLGGLTDWSAAPADYERDVAVVLAFAAGLVVLWALAAIVSNHSGFKILAIAMLVVALPLATAVLAVQHPTWWIAGLGAAGGVLILLGLPLGRRRARSAA